METTGRSSYDFPALSEKEFLIMKMLLDSGEMFGLEMVEKSNGSLKKGTIYVTLQRMEKKNLLTSEEEERAENEIGIARRFYRPSNWGERVFKAQEIALKYLNMGGW